jgi:hypothetical protein
VAVADAVSSVEKAVFGALSSGGAVSATVYSHAPENAAYPLVIIGDIEAVRPIGRADDADRRMLLTVLALTQGEERKPCTAMLGQVEAALNGKTLTEGTWSITLMLDQVSATLAEDGQGYVGLAQFSVLALGN